MYMLRYKFREAADLQGDLNAALIVMYYICCSFFSCRVLTLAMLGPKIIGLPLATGCVTF